MKGKIDKALREALYKKAVGYVAEESVDELVADPYDGGMKLVKRKITKKTGSARFVGCETAVRNNGRQKFRFDVHERRTADGGKAKAGKPAGER